MMSLIICEAISTDEILMKDFIPLISPVIVIIIFVIDRIIGFILRKKEVERNWYLKVLIEPCLTEISSFYDNVLNNYKTSCDLLRANSQKPHNEYTHLKSKEFGKFQQCKRELEVNVIIPIQSRYNDVGEKILEELRNLEDLYTTSLDQEKFSEEDIQKLYFHIASNRALFLNHLYLPVESRFWS